MPWLVSTISAVIAAVPPTDPLWRRAIGQLSVAMLISIVTIIAVGMVAMMLIRRHRRRLQGQYANKRKRRPPADPWFEAARRVPEPEGGPKSRVIQLPGREPIRPAGSDDDTVDIDPDELDQHDVEGEDDEDDEPPTPPKPSRGG